MKGSTEKVGSMIPLLTPRYPRPQLLRIRKMPRKREELLIYGASGHAKVVIDAAERSGKHKIVGVVDDEPPLHGQNCSGYPVLGGFEKLTQLAYRHCQVVIAVGSNQARYQLYERLATLGCQFACIVHPSAQIGRGVILGPGTVVMAGAVINTDTVVGQHVIINTGATVDHDCRLGDFVHISPGVHLAGGVRVEKLAHVGIGVSVIQGVTIGEGTIIGAGAAVIENVPDHVTAVGVPAKVIKKS